MTLASIVQHRAAVAGDRAAYTFLADGAGDARSLTWRELDARASAMAAALQARGASGERVLLALPSGLAFVESLLGCFYAGAVAVPVSLPRHARVKHRLDRVVADAGAAFAIGTASTRERLERDGVDAGLGMAWVDPEMAGSGERCEPAAAGLGELSLLQYTSGSTGSPRGVMVSQGNLLANSAQIAEACGHGEGSTIAGWLPLFHDMGLIGLVIQAAYSGARCVLMSPERFLMRPWQWLQMVSDYGACSSPAPNFAYQLCAAKVTAEQKKSLDLSGWRNALNGSEPVRGATMERFVRAFAECGFKKEATFPCYGLAEATLFVSGPGASRRLMQRSTGGAEVQGDEIAGHVGCGAVFGDMRLAIVDPVTKERRDAGEIGEIWVAGASCAMGYWKHPEATTQTFNGRISGSAEEGPWLRTGDLGMVVEGELFITGRLREMIIVCGRNLFPVDLERTAEAADDVIATGGVAAFAVEVGGSERLVMVLEVRREAGRGAAELHAAEVCRRVKAAVAQEWEVSPHDVVVVQSGGLARTTSGKLSRSGTRAAYLEGSLDRWKGKTHESAGV